MVLAVSGALILIDRLLRLMTGKLEDSELIGVRESEEDTHRCACTFEIKSEHPISDSCRIFRFSCWLRIVRAFPSLFRCCFVVLP
jgi:hypothetical protein